MHVEYVYGKISYIVMLLMDIKVFTLVMLFMTSYYIKSKSDKS